MADFSDIGELQPLIEEASKYIANFSIGFGLLIKSDSGEDILPAGSGALVSIGPIFGILTAAHVLENLPERGSVGLIKFTPNASIQRQSIEMGHAEKLIVGDYSKSSGDKPRSPDIGFLRLAAHDVGALNSTNVFFNLEKRQASILGKLYPSSFYFEGIAGIVAEWTSDSLRSDGRHLLRGFRGLFGVGVVERNYESEEFDLVDFEVSYDPSSAFPQSYEGVSGGALWRVHFAKDDNGTSSVASSAIFGVAFHQSPVIDNKRVLTCHGIASVYERLFDAVRERWPPN